MNRDKIYQTKDIFEASFLYATGVPLLELERDDRYFFFVFEDHKSTCGTLSKSYWTETTTKNVNAKSFVNAQKSLRDLIFSKGGTR
ncbi:hypothetical protein A2982_00540 [candidate division WWE3 bacterium RIFCSPLOWO2_01_FULL_39_13]|uniref:DUF5659 domain-containing protein n=1 Tax=candidate division WWE3 bacterium RIFCSPLOWO2_01_FULL_39_13 TaxID=1802624 RepID=A0A1F4V3F0_UNCKA|nr:MAG: hypothetical protein A2982_00540 [candidate division WWE3 bacterium RIFCSPLOWO2_01_FULL_39_13]